MIEPAEPHSGRKSAGLKISLQIENRVARIVLNNPPLNTLNLELLDDISKAIHTAAREEGLCAIVFEPSPESRAFSAGIAIEEQRGDVAYQMIDAFLGVFRNLHFYSKPTVAIVPDAALGAGCELAAYCDFVIASEKARFGLPQVKTGLFPPLASVHFPRVVGEKRAKEMILTGALYTAQEALSYGLVSHVVPEDRVRAKAEEVLDMLRKMSAPVLEVARRAIAETAGMPLTEALERAEDLYLNSLMNLSDPGEGIVALLEKRAPHWRHR